MAGGDLDVPQVHARIEHRGDEGMAEHVRVRPGNPHPGGFGQPLQTTGGSVAVHPGTPAVEQDGAADAGANRPVDGPAGSWRQRDQDHLGAFAAHAQHPVTMFFAQVGDVSAGGLEDPQAKQPEHSHEREIMPVAGLAGGGEQGLEL